MGAWMDGRTSSSSSVCLASLFSAAAGWWVFGSVGLFVLLLGWLSLLGGGHRRASGGGTLSHSLSPPHLYPLLPSLGEGALHRVGGMHAYTHVGGFMVTHRALRVRGSSSGRHIWTYLLRFNGCFWVCAHMLTVRHSPAVDIRAERNGRTDANDHHRACACSHI